MQTEINFLISAKDTLEADLSTQSLQRDMLSNDVLTVSSELEAMKAAYSGLESETIDIRRAHRNSQIAADAIAAAKLANPDKEDEDRKRKTEEDDAQKLEIERLQEELSAATKRLKELDRLVSLVSSLELAKVTLENEKAHLNVNVRGLTEEVVSYKRLTDSLKEKLRQVSSSDTKDFLDTFEEVMREEMNAMKMAFEGKLRAAKEVTDNMSRKHQQDIQRMQQVAPASSFKAALGVLGNSTASSKAAYGSPGPFRH